MHIAWPDLAAALGLVLVIEGILPFLGPAAFRGALMRVAGSGDATLRAGGAVSMLAGLAVLWLARG
jgi:uncharacterized protein YjeT (DUF2065 family)